MPKLYEYLGIIVFFYSNEHEPVHVHGRHGECESKIEIIVKNGVVQSIKLQNVSGKRPLPAVLLGRGKELPQGRHAFYVPHNWDEPEIDPFLEKIFRKAEVHDEAK